MDFSKEPGPADRRAFLEVPFSATHVDADAESRLPYAAASAVTSFPEARPPVLLLRPPNRCAVTAGDWVCQVYAAEAFPEDTGFKVRHLAARPLSTLCLDRPLSTLCLDRPLSTHASTDRAIPVSAAPLSAQQQVRELEAQCALFRPLVQVRRLYAINLYNSHHI
jgi:hypothetical protein